METENNLSLLKPINQPCDTQLFVTPRAIQRLSALQHEEQQSSSPAPRFRIRVDSGGCAGFQYVFSFDRAQNNDDIIFSSNSVECIVDEMSLSLQKNQHTGI